MRGQKTDPEIEQRVREALIAGMAVREAARKFSLSPATVSAINSAIPRLMKERTVRTEEGGDDIGAKLAELVLANAEGMIGIAKIAKEPSYLKTQQAGGLAQLYAALADTTLQLLEAAENASCQDEPAE